MIRILSSLVRQLVFWLLVFFISRLVFLLYNARLLYIEGVGFLESLSAFWHALPLDLATACYFLVFCLLIAIVQAIYPAKWLNYLNKAWVLLLLVVFFLLTTAELGIYPEWKTKMPYKALMYLKNPAEVYNSSSTLTFVLLIALFVLQVACTFWLYNRYFYKNITTAPRRRILTALGIAVLGIPLVTTGARGGWQEIPITQSESYYSEHNILNLASVNSAFNMYISVYENLRNFDKNPYEFYFPSEARELVNKLYIVKSDTTVKILTSAKPNIVLIILESWSADLIESLGGEPGITPNFKELEKEGVLFTNMYPTGPRSEQGMGSIFSGFPAHPISSVTVQPEKFAKLPTFTRQLIDHGYSTSFYFGGQLRYGNIKGYIHYNGFKRIIENNDFGKDAIYGKLGAHDEFVFRRQLNDMKEEKQPFFSSVYTLSSHSPYDQPMEKVLTWGDNENQYINSAYYTDKCLGEYFREAKKQPWYANTLFIIVADHSHNSYRNWSFTTPNYHKIPMLLFGEVIDKHYKGKTVERLSNQMDIAATLMKQLDLDSSPFKWSRDLFNPGSPEFAYYSFEEGMGWVTKNGYFVYDTRADYFNENTLPDEDKARVIREGRSFMQVLFDEYMNL